MQQHKSNKSKDGKKKQNKTLLVPSYSENALLFQFNFICFDHFHNQILFQRALHTCEQQDSRQKKTRLTVKIFQI